MRGGRGRRGFPMDEGILGNTEKSGGSRRKSWEKTLLLTEKKSGAGKTPGEGLRGGVQGGRALC